MKWKIFIPQPGSIGKAVWVLLLASVFTNAFSVKITSALIIASTLLYLLTLPLTKCYPALDKTLLAVILLYFAAQLACSLFALYPAYSLQWSAKYIVLYSLQFFLASAIVRTPRRYACLLLALVAGVLLVDASVTAGYLIHGDGRRSIKPLLEVQVMQLPDWLNCIIWPWALALADGSGGRRRIVFITMLLLALSGIVLNGGRNAWVAVVVQTLAYFLFMRRYRLAAFSAALIVALGFLMIFLPQVSGRMALFADPAARTNVNRLMLWRYSLDIMRDFPAAGIGNGSTFKTVFNAFYTHGYPFTEKVAHAHNIFLARLTETGIVGLMAFLFMIGTMLQKAWERYRLDSATKPAALAGFLVLGGWMLMNQADYSIHLTQISRAFWIVVALIFSDRKICSGGYAFLTGNICCEESK